MKAVEALVLLAVAGFVTVWLLRQAWTRWMTRRALSHARWRPKSITAGNTTRVLCQRVAVTPRREVVLEEQELDVVPVSDPDYDDRLHEMMSKARYRASTLNSESR